MYTYCMLHTFTHSRLLQQPLSAPCTSCGWPCCSHRFCMAEVYIFGQLVGAYAFGQHNLFCAWEIATGSNWTHVEGETRGQTHIAADSEPVVWAQPVDVHYKAHTLHGWPKLIVHVWHQDSYGRMVLCGYGLGYIPAPTKKTSYQASLEITTWKPQAGIFQQLRNMLLGGSVCLLDEQLVWRTEGRCRLRTTTSGTVRFTLNVICQNAEGLGMSALAKPTDS